MTIRGPDPFAAPAQGPYRDDPFARARAAQLDELTPALQAEPSDTLAGQLARRDPDAPSEESAAFQLSGPSSLDDLLRRARLRGFLMGAVVGAALVAGGIAVGSWWLRAPASTVAAPAAAPEPPQASPAQPPLTPQEPHVLPLPLDAGAAPDGRPTADPAVPAPSGGSRPRRAPAPRRRAGPGARR